MTQNAHERVQCESRTNAIDRERKSLRAQLSREEQELRAQLGRWEMEKLALDDDLGEEAGMCKNERKNTFKEGRIQKRLNRGNKKKKEYIEPNGAPFYFGIVYRNE